MENSSSTDSRFSVGDLVVDTGRRQISRAGSPIDVAKLTFDLLVVLAENAPNVVSHEELISRTWPGRVVSQETLTQRIKLLRQAIGDDAGAPRYIGLVRGEGYRLIPDVRELPPAGASLSQNLFAELGRRRVIKAALIYAAAAWSITEVFSFLIDALPVFPAWSKAFIAILFVVGFPVAMFLAWRFDTGPGGIQRTEASSTAGRLTIAAAMILLVGATAGLFYMIYPNIVELPAGGNASISTMRADQNTIAVLPFVNAGNLDEDVYLSEGLGDELRDRLGQVEGLRVPARSSSIRFRNADIDATEISRMLGVSKLIEGSLRRQGEQLRITVQVIDGSTGFQDWTRNYSRNENDIVDLHDEIVAELVSEEFPQLRAETAPHTTDPVANDLMWVARHHFQQVKDRPIVDLELLLKAIDLYRQATELDPESAVAHSRLGAALLYLGDIDGAEEPIFRALALDADSSEVQLTLGLYYYRRYLPGAGNAFERAVELNPNNVDAVSAYAIWTWSQGDTTAAEPYFQRALALDRATISRYGEIGNFYGIVGETEKAREIADQLTNRFVDARAYLEVARIYELLGELDVAIAWAHKARNLEPGLEEATWMLAEMYSRIGDFEASGYYEPEASMTQLFYARRYEDLVNVGEEYVLENPNDSNAWYLLVRAYLALGDYELAERALKRRKLPENIYVDSRRTTELEATVSLADALKMSGKEAEAKEIGEWLVAFYQNSYDRGTADSWWINLYLSCSLAIVDRDDEALTSLDRLTTVPGHAWYPVVMDQPCFQKFAGNPRYEKVVTFLQQKKNNLREMLPHTLARLQSP